MELALEMGNFLQEGVFLAMMSVSVASVGAVGVSVVVDRLSGVVERRLVVGSGVLAWNSVEGAGLLRSNVDWFRSEGLGRNLGWLLNVDILGPWLDWSYWSHWSDWGNRSYWVGDGWSRLRLGHHNNRIGSWLGPWLNVDVACMGRSRRGRHEGGVSGQHGTGWLRDHRVRWNRWPDNLDVDWDVLFRK